MKTNGFSDGIPMIRSGRAKPFKIAGVLFGGFFLLKAAVWFPLRALFQFPTWTSVAKAAATVILASPPGYFGTGGHQVMVNNETYLVDDPSSVNLIRLLDQFPLPPEILDRSQSRQARLEKLAVHVSGILPLDSVKPQNPEPVSALEILGEKDGVMYPKLCSKDAKIFVQYAAALGFTTRMVQLEHHVAAGVFNPEDGQWEMYDPYFGCAPRYRGKVISSVVANELYERGLDFEFCGPKSVFGSVTLIPRTDFGGGTLPAWHYFNYNNLAYWRHVRS